MAEFDFDPPITLRRNIVVFTLDDAAAFVRSYKDAELRNSQSVVLRRLPRRKNLNEKIFVMATYPCEP
jgi:hypothetical protein